MTTQNFKPILFSTEMVQAILDGRKTQTRRVLEMLNPNWWRYDGPDKNGSHFMEAVDREGEPLGNYFEIGKSKYQKGDILWVRETSIVNTNSGFRGFVAEGYIKTSDYEKTVSSIHMPREAARIFLEVTDVRVERLQDISEEDAIAEGVNDNNGRCENYLSKNPSDWFGDSRDSFQSLWEKINGKKHPWDSNPWVWVYNFKRIEKPENF